MAARPLSLRPSANVLSASYDEDTRTLSVTFHSGRTYTYPGIDSATAQDFENAASPGGFVARHLRGREG